jgi:hypothetical protein
MLGLPTPAIRQDPNDLVELQYQSLGSMQQLLQVL